MAFDFVFTDCISYDLITPMCEATVSVKVGELREKSYTELTVLSKRDYLSQWFKAVSRLKEGHNSSAIITSLGHHEEVIGIWWPLFMCEHGRIAVQNRLILRKHVGYDFSIKTCYDYIGTFVKANDEGKRISEWNTTLNEIAAFGDTLKRRLAALDRPGEEQCRQS